jgi:hypothetical protein
MGSYKECSYPQSARACKDLIDQVHSRFQLVQHGPIALGRLLPFKGDGSSLCFSSVKASAHGTLEPASIVHAAPFT